MTAVITDWALGDLRARFPEAVIWHGQYTGSLWALVHDRTGTARLVEAATPEEMRQRLHAARMWAHPQPVVPQQAPRPDVRTPPRGWDERAPRTSGGQWSSGVGGQQSWRRDAQAPQWDGQTPPRRERQRAPQWGEQRPPSRSGGRRSSTPGGRRAARRPERRGGLLRRLLGGLVVEGR